MSEHSPINVQEAFDPELRQAQADLNLYTENRPNRDDKGIAHDPATGRVIDPETYFDTQRSIAEEASQTPYEEMSMPELARTLAAAEFHNDRTSMINLNDALLDKMVEYSEKHNSARDAEHNSVRDDVITNRIMSIKEKELARLQTENKEDHEAGVSPQFVRYQPRRDGRVQLGFEIDQDGAQAPMYRTSVPNIEVDAANAVVEGEHKLILSDSQENEYYIINDTIHKFAKSGNDIQHIGSVSFDQNDDSQKLVSAEIGKQWTMPDGTVTDHPITSVEYATQVIEADQPSDGYEANGSDPFYRAEAKLAEVEELAKTPTVEPVHTPSITQVVEKRPNIRERLRNRKKIIGAALAALVLGSVAYAPLDELVESSSDHNAPAAAVTSSHNSGPRLTRVADVHKAASKSRSATTSKTATYSFQAGDNPWTVSATQLRKKGNLAPSNAEIAAYDQRMAELNGNYSMNLDDHRDEALPVGAKLKLPR